MIASLAPIPASAGVFSAFFDAFIRPAEASTQSVPANSQTVALLDGATNSAAVGGSETVIANQSALLPDSGPLGTSADIEEIEPASDQISLYTVRKGDTLSGIANMFQVSVNTIIWANELKGGVISEGQTLVILPITGVRYTVKSGDTVEKLSSRFNATAEDIYSYNGLAVGTKLSAGAELIIPNGEIPAPAPAPKKVTVKVATGSAGTGYFRHPLPGGIKTQGIHGHNAIDIGAPTGTPVYAAASGDVILSRQGGWGGGYGNYVVVSHPNGTQTLYAHFSSVAVPVGTKVTKGQVVGYVGSTGLSTGPHLHFEVRGARNPF